MPSPVSVHKFSQQLPTQIQNNKTLIYAAVAGIALLFLGATFYAVYLLIPKPTIFDAIKNRDVEAVKNHLANSAFDPKVKKGKSLIAFTIDEYAALRNKDEGKAALQAIFALLCRDSRIDINGADYLKLLTQNKTCRVLIEEVLNHPDLDLKSTTCDLNKLLMIAIKMNNADFANKIVAAGAQPNKRCGEKTPIAVAMKANNVNMLRIFKDFIKQDHLCKAIKLECSNNVLQFLIKEAELDVNDDNGGCPLTYAIQTKDAKRIVGFLLKQTISSESIVKAILPIAQRSSKPKESEVEVLKMLLANEQLTKDNYNNIFEYACGYGHEEFLLLLLNTGKVTQLNDRAYKRLVESKTTAVFQKLKELDVTYLPKNKKGMANQAYTDLMDTGIEAVSVKKEEGLELHKKMQQELEFRQAVYCFLNPEYEQSQSVNAIA